MSTRTWNAKVKTNKSPSSSKHGNASADKISSYNNISSFYENLSSDSEASVGENLDKLKELFSGKKPIGTLLSASPPKNIPLVKTNTTQA